MGKIPFAFCWPVMCPTRLNQFSVSCITHVKRRISGFRISCMYMGTELHIHSTGHALRKIVANWKHSFTNTLLMTLYNQTLYLTHKDHALCDNGSVANCPHRHVLLEYLLSFKGLFTCFFLILQWFGKAIFHQDVIRLPLHWHHNEHWRLKSPASQLLTQSFIQTQIIENIKVPRHWPLCGEFTGTGEFPAQRASYAENISIWWRHHVLSFQWYQRRGVSLCNSLIKYEKKTILHITDPLWG